jgi:flagellar biosynthesis activator protein FlaF
MNAAHLAQTAYSPARPGIQTARSTEYAVFARITRNLTAAAGRGKSGFSALVTALHENRRLWRILAADVADENNGLPAQLRAQIFYLAEFTDLHTSKVLAGNEIAGPLVEINTSIMRGLRARQGAGA